MLFYPKVVVIKCQRIYEKDSKKTLPAKNDDPTHRLVFLKVDLSLHTSKIENVKAQKNHKTLKFGLLSFVFSNDILISWKRNNISLLWPFCLIFFKSIHDFCLLSQEK